MSKLDLRELPQNERVAKGSRCQRNRLRGTAAIWAEPIPGPTTPAAGRTLASDSDVSVELRLHHGVKLDVLRRHGIRSRQVWRDVFVEPRFLLLLAVPNFAHGESAGRRISDVDDEAGLLLHLFVEFRGTSGRRPLGPFRWR